MTDPIREAALLRECAELVDRLRELRAPRDIEEGSLLLNVCDYHALDDLSASLRTALAAAPESTLRVPQTPTTGVNAIVGKWPGNETDEQIAAALAPPPPERERLAERLDELADEAEQTGREPGWLPCAVTIDEADIGRLRAAAALLRAPVEREALKAAIRQGLREWTLTYQPSENYAPLTIAPLAWLLADNIPPEAFNSVADAVLAAMAKEAR